MIRYLCGGCDSVLYSAYRLAGLPIKCELCRFENLVPHESSDEQPRAFRRRPAPPPIAPPQRRSSMVPLMIGLAFVLVVVGVAVTFGVYSLQRSRPMAGQGEGSSLTRTFEANDGRSQLQVPGEWRELSLGFGEGQLKVGTA